MDETVSKGIFPFLTAIACVDSNYAIGKNGELGFHLRDDMKRFVELTTDQIVVMGRKTFESLPNGEPLKSRTNYVLTTNKNFKHDGLDGVFHDVDTLVRTLYDTVKETFQEPFVIGGGQIYKLLMPWTRDILLTVVKDKTIDNADTFFPHEDLVVFKKVSEESVKTFDRISKSEVDISYVDYSLKSLYYVY